MPCFIMHHWTPWKLFKEGHLMRHEKDGTKTEVGYALFQQRQCTRCNKIEIREDKVKV